MQRQSCLALIVALVIALGLLTGAPLAQAKNHLKKPLIERTLAKAKRTRESRALIREQQRKEKQAKEAAKQKAQPASAPVAPQR